MIKTCLSLCVCIVIGFGALLAVLSMTAITVNEVDHYLTSYEQVLEIEQYQAAQKYSEDLLAVTQEVIQEKELLDEANKGLQLLVDDLKSRVEIKEGVIADYCQTTQDMAMTNRNLSIQLKRLNALCRWCLRNMNEDEKKRAMEWYDELMQDGQYQ